MRRVAISLTATLLFMMAVVVSSLPIKTEAQTENQTTKSVFTESFTFPNECTGELMDVTDRTVVTCHDQLRADSTFNEKCEIRQDVAAVGETTGITFHGSGTFKDEFTATDGCNFSFTNRGRVHLISNGSDANLILTFDETTVKENCVLTTDTHLVSADCRGSRE
jgi:hypothetical protein